MSGNVHAGLNWNAIPTLINAPNPPSKVTGKRKAPTERKMDPNPKKSQLQDSEDGANSSLVNEDQRNEEIGSIRQLKEQVTSLKQQLASEKRRRRRVVSTKAATKLTKDKLIGQLGHYISGWYPLLMLVIAVITVGIFYNLAKPTSLQAPEYLPKGLVELNTHNSDQNHIMVTSSKKNNEPLSQLAILASKKAINNRLIISVVDAGYIEMALNLWETSFVRFGITNYLFICMDNKVKKLLPDGANDCLLMDNGLSGSASPFGSAAFNHKVMVKTRLSLELLYLGYSVIVVDLDIVFFKNPLPYLTCRDCDLIIQNNNGGELNSGFYMIKPTKNAIELQEQSLERAEIPGHPNDQNIMNQLILISNKLRVIVLNINQFQPGLSYFSEKSNFPNDVDCRDCVIVHNNWIVGIRPKIYRFKEMLLWVADTNGYYTSTENNYIMYSYPKNANKDQEKQALELAFNVGKMLSRIVILPQFNCGSYHCHLLNAFGSDYLENLTESTYRESVFLLHPKVPKSTKTSISPEIDLARLITNTSLPTSILANLIVEAIISNSKFSHYKVVKLKTLIFDDEADLGIQHFGKSFFYYAVFIAVPGSFCIIVAIFVTKKLMNSKS